MFFRFGHMPGTKRFLPTRTCASAYRLSIVAAAALLSVSTATADLRVPLTIAEAESIASTNEPGFIALQAEADALQEQSIAVGELPDPELRIGLSNYPINSGSFSSEGMTQAQLGIHQAFPRNRLRSMSTAQFRALADVQTSSANTRSRDVLEATRTTWLEAYYWQRSEQILDESRPLFQDLLEVTQSLYSVGKKSQSDVLRAELALKRLDDRLLNASRSRSSAQGALSEWLGRDAYRPIADKLPDWEQLPSEERLLESLANNPLMRASDSEIQARHANVGIAEEKGKPGWALNVAYGYRDGYLPSGEPRSDFISLNVVVDLPMFKKNRQDRNLAAALSARRAAVSGKQQVSARLQSQVSIKYAHWADLTRRMQLYETDILALTENQAESALLAYQSDAGDFSAAMLDQIGLLNTRLEYIRIQVERAQNYAALANLGGLAL